MESNFSFVIIVCLTILTFYYYTKFKDTEDKCKTHEKEFTMLNKHIDKLYSDNSNYKIRIKDLQKYKNDVSKTFKILDNELVNINNHVEKHNQMNRHIDRDRDEQINLLTPQLLTNLIENMNQDFLSFNTNSNDDDDTLEEPIRENNMGVNGVNESNVVNGSNGGVNGNTINNLLRSLSFPNLPNAYQRLMNPIINNITSGNSVLSIQTQITPLPQI